MKKTLLIGALISAFALPLSSCGKKHEEAKHEASVPFDGATKFTVAALSINDLKPIVGFYTSDDDTQARARIGGTLVSLNVTEGQEVAKGQLIGTIDEARFAAEIEAGAANAKSASSMANASMQSAKQAPANLAAAAALAQKAQADYIRTKQLFDQGVYAQARLDQMSAALAAANAQVQAAKAGVNAANASADAAKSQAGAAGAQVKIAQAMRAQGKIYAPKAGKVTVIPVSQGQVVMPGEVVAFIAGGASVLRMKAPEKDAANLRVGQQIAIKGTDGAVTSYTSISKIYPLVENGMVKIDLESDGTEHFVGERIEVLLPIGNRQAIVIPASYIITRQGVDFVRLVRADKALEIPIQRGQVQSVQNITDGVEILSGLNIGDIIVAPTMPKGK